MTDMHREAFYPAVLERLCRESYAKEDGYPGRDSNPKRYGIFREGFYAGAVRYTRYVTEQQELFLRDALMHGTGFMRDGKHIDRREVFIDPVENEMRDSHE